MKYIKVAEIANKWGLSERTVRNYCANNRLDGAKLIGKTWMIPEDASKPDRINKKRNDYGVLPTLLKEKKNAQKGGIYHKVQVDFTYNSNHIEGSELSMEQTRYIYDTNTIGISEGSINVDDIVETANHFRCIDMVIDNAGKQLSESFIKSLHYCLKNGTMDSRKEWFAVGEYKKLPNEVAGKETSSPENVEKDIKALICHYNTKKIKTLDDILEFHYKFEKIHPFSDGNGRVGRLIMFKECLKNNIVPFIIDEELKLFYLRGLNEWEKERGYLRDTCLSAQDKFKTYLDYFRIDYR